MSEELFRQVVDFVSEEACVRRRRITAQTRLLQDLGMDGDDADEFMAKFFVRFAVDGRGFVFSRYFGPEGCLPIPFVSKLWPSLVPITIGDLVDSATYGAWSLPSCWKCGYDLRGSIHICPECGTPHHRPPKRESGMSGDDMTSP